MIHALKAFHLRLGEIGRQGADFDFQPDDADRAQMAATLGLVELKAFQAKVRVHPWLDGVEIHGVWSGVVVQTCGVSLDEFETPLASQFLVRAVPQGSPHAPQTDAEVDLDPEADDPPDVLEGDKVDLGAYVIEHLGLELDPFPRKPGVVFEAPDAAPLISPFAALRNLKPE